ncbi:translation factor GUF1 homolog, mitochondrial [Trichonephila clavipes]|nr:translation factor GUF1 homolog, mitochondrial [Trichonephila clavipes]
MTPCGRSCHSLFASAQLIPLYPGRLQLFSQRPDMLIGERSATWQAHGRRHILEDIVGRVAHCQSAFMTTKDDRVSQEIAPHTVTPCEIAVCRSTINAGSTLAGALQTRAVVISTETESGFITGRDTSPVCHTPSCPEVGKNPVDTAHDVGSAVRLSGRRLLKPTSVSRLLMVSLDGTLWMSGRRYESPVIKIKGKSNIKKYGGEEIIVSNPQKFPDPIIVEEYYEPMVLGTIITPEKYYSSILNMCMNRRGEQRNINYFDNETIVLTYKFPLGEIIMDFFNELKILSSGYASFDYEEIGYESSRLKKVDIYLNGKIVEELSIITHASQVEKLGRLMCLRLKECIDPQLFLIAIQACTDGKKIIARENIKALKKDVTAKLYGGDVTRRMKLLQRQKEGKKNMRMIGDVVTSGRKMEIGIVQSWRPLEGLMHIKSVEVLCPHVGMVWKVREWVASPGVNLVI